MRRELLELPVNHQRIMSSDGLLIGVSSGGRGLQRRDIALYPSLLVVVRVLMLVRVSKMVVVVVVRMLVHGDRPGVRLQITSRVVVEPDEAITGDINIRHDSTLCTERSNCGGDGGDGG